jgi:hypothetical protein
VIAAQIAPRDRRGSRWPDGARLTGASTGPLISDALVSSGGSAAPCRRRRCRGKYLHWGDAPDSRGIHTKDQEPGKDGNHGQYSMQALAVEVGIPARWHRGTRDGS